MKPVALESLTGSSACSCAGRRDGSTVCLVPALSVAKASLVKHQIILYILIPSGAESRLHRHDAFPHSPFTLAECCVASVHMLCMYVCMYVYMCVCAWRQEHSQSMLSQTRQIGLWSHIATDASNALTHSHAQHTHTHTHTRAKQVDPSKDGPTPLPRLGKEQA
jgi:hypothetical protein